MERAVKVYVFWIHGFGYMENELEDRGRVDTGYMDTRPLSNYSLPACTVA
jgi:hypothetical protein